MSVKITSTNPSIAGSREALVRNLKALKAPEEGGTKKEYEDLLEKSRTTSPSAGILESTSVTY